MNSETSKYFIALTIGFIYHQFLLLFWSYSRLYNPITNMLFECCASKGWFRLVLYGHDLVVNLLLSFALAFALIKLDAKRFWFSVILAVSIGIIYSYHQNLFNFFVHSSVFSLGYELFVMVLSCPIAILMINYLHSEKN